MVSQVSRHGGMLPEQEVHQVRVARHRQRTWHTPMPAPARIMAICAMSLLVRTAKLSRFHIRKVLAHHAQVGRLFVVANERVLR